jgi:hypothetical protein
MKLSWLHYPIIGTFAVALALWFATTLRPVQSSVQYEFDSWLEGQRRSIEQLSAYFIANQELKTEQDGVAQNETVPNEPVPSKAVDSSSSSNQDPTLLDVAQLPHLRAALRLEGGRIVRFSLPPEPNPNRPYQILRLLDLMKAAGIFDRSSQLDADDFQGQPSVTITVQGPGRTFEAAIPQYAVEKNVAALLMLRLFKEYGVEVSEPEVNGQPVESAFLSSPPGLGEPAK